MNISRPYTPVRSHLCSAWLAHSVRSLLTSKSSRWCPSGIWCPEPAVLPTFCPMELQDLRKWHAVERGSQRLMTRAGEPNCSSLAVGIDPLNCCEQSVCLQLCGFLSSSIRSVPLQHRRSLQRSEPPYTGSPPTTTRASKPLVSQRSSLRRYCTSVSLSLALQSAQDCTLARRACGEPSQTGACVALGCVAVYHQCRRGVSHLSR